MDSKATLEVRHSYKSACKLADEYGLLDGYVATIEAIKQVKDRNGSMLSHVSTSFSVIDLEDDVYGYGKVSYMESRECQYTLAVSKDLHLLLQHIYKLAKMQGHPRVKTAEIEIFNEMISKAIMGTIVMFISKWRFIMGDD